MNIRRLAGGVWIISAILSMLIIRFENHDLSETRLLLEFWPHWLGLAVLLIAGIVLAFR